MYQGKVFQTKSVTFYEVVFQWPGAPWSERWRVDRVHGYDRSEVGRFESEAGAEIAAERAARAEAHAQEGQTP